MKSHFVFADAVLGGEDISLVDEASSTYQVSGPRHNQEAHGPWLVLSGSVASHYSLLFFFVFLCGTTLPLILMAMVSFYRVVLYLADPGKARGCSTIN
jgi:hypothetical protein